MSNLSRMYRNDTNVPFSALWRKTLVVSAALILIGVLSLFTRGLNLGLEFEGGAAWEVPAAGVSADDARDALRSLGLADARVQTGGDVLRVRADLQAGDAKVADVSTALADLADQPLTAVSVSTAGPSWGDEITDKAVNALIWFFIVIAIYITVRLRWEMSVGALVAVGHDIIITVGLYALFQFEVTPPTVIAFLTIMGYSLYDTLVVFDKARDNEYRLANTKLSYRDSMELSLNQVLMRSINTSITSILPVLSVLIVGSVFMGAVTLREFALALLIGLIIGTLSSLFVAAPVATWLRERFGSSDADSNREFRLSDAVKRQRGGRSVAPSGSTPAGAIPPRPRKQKRR